MYGKMHIRMLKITSAKVLAIIFTLGYINRILADMIHRLPFSLAGCAFGCMALSSTKDPEYYLE